MRFGLILASCFLAGCAAVPPPATRAALPNVQSEMAPGGTPVSGRATVTPRRTAQRGPVNLARLKHYRHPAAQSMLRTITSKILSVSGTDSAASRKILSPDVAILDVSAYNAILQGNRLYITRGMLALMNDEAEMAAVLAHEIAHALAGHARRRVAARRQAVASAIDVAQTYRDPERTRQAVAIQKRTLAAFSREQEFEADRVGLELMVRAGYDPRAAVRSLIVHERMKTLFARTSGLRSRQTVSLLATHPATPERIARMRTMVAALKQQSGQSNRNANRNGYLAAIDGIRFGNANSNGFIRGRNVILLRRDVAVTMPRGFVAVGSRRSVLGVRCGGKAFFIFAALKPQFANNAEAIVTRMITRMGGRGGVEQLKNRTGARGFSSSPKGERRVAVLKSGQGAYSIIMFTRKKYSGFDRDFRAAIASVRPLTSRDRAIARPWNVRLVRATGPGTIARYARSSGGGEIGKQLLLALNGLRSAEQVKPGMRLKVLEFVGR